jgi:hypothetical protein
MRYYAFVIFMISVVVHLQVQGWRSRHGHCEQQIDEHGDPKHLAEAISKMSYGLSHADNRGSIRRAERAALAPRGDGKAGDRRWPRRNITSPQARPQTL